MQNRRLLIVGLAALLAAAAIPLSFIGPPGLRLAVIGLFLLSGPGVALVLLLRLDNRSSTLSTLVGPLLGALAIGFSVAVSILVATVMVYAQLWSPPWAVTCLAVATLAALAWDWIKHPEARAPSHVPKRAAGHAHVSQAPK